jgi:sulfonate transport system permease protein
VVRWLCGVGCACARGIDAPGLGFLTVGRAALPEMARVLDRFRAVALQLVPWLVPVGLIALWQVASSLGCLSTRVLPAPIEVVAAA